jgi:DNA-directed RNA polymerase II subunit RPB11
MNAPNRLDSCRLPEGVAKVAAAVDGKMPNATTYTLRREDHTLGHMLRM